MFKTENKNPDSSCSGSVLERYHMSDSLVVEFSVSKEHFRRMEFDENGRKFSICHIYPKLSDYRAGLIPDKVNPRSHEENVLKGSVVNEIKETLISSPEDMILANRGATILASKVLFDPDKSRVKIILSEHDDRSTALHGIADGATSDAVISLIQKSEIDSINLSKARFHIQVYTGLEDRDDIKKLSKGKNRSKSVKSWSIADWSGKFDSLKQIIELSKFKDRIGYEENSGKPANILDVISVMTLFHPIYENPNNLGITSAYSSKGTMDERFTNEEMIEGYKQLENILEDLLELHDYVYCNFDITNKNFSSKNGKQIRVGRRKNEATDQKTFPDRNVELPFTGNKTKRYVAASVLYPMLASLRCLIDFSGKKAVWKIDPKKFWDVHGPEIQNHMLELLEEYGNNPNTFGKKSHVYKALHQTALVSKLQTTL